MHNSKHCFIFVRYLRINLTPLSLDGTNTSYSILICHHFPIESVQQLTFHCYHLNLSCIMMKTGLTYFKNLCGVNTAIFLKYVWPFFIFMYERIKQLDIYTIAVFSLFEKTHTGQFKYDEIMISNTVHGSE